MKKRTALFACVLALLTVFAVAAFAADDINVPLNDKLSFRGISATVTDGVLDLDIQGLNEKNESPAIFFPGVDVDANVYRYIKMEVKSEVSPLGKNKTSHGFYFRTTDVTGSIKLPEGVEMVMPGDHVDMEVTLITPIAIEEGLRFAIREGGRTVGSGVVAKIIK